MSGIARIGAIATVVSVLLHPTQAIPRDLITLSRFVAPAYTAMNVAVICAKEDSSFLSTTAGIRGTAIHYAAHVKDEIIVGLSDAEARFVLRQAADRAREVAMVELERLARLGPLQAEVRMWCRDTARGFLQYVMNHHDQRHDQWLAAVTHARD